jgi:hypothetical protein
MRNSDQDTYWASVPSDEIADKILERVDNFYEYLQISGRLQLYMRSYNYYYRPRFTGGRLAPVGEQGELTSMSVNNYRNLLSHLETMTTQQAPYFEPKATNSDAKSQAQVILATGLLDYYMREKNLSVKLKTAVKTGLIFGDSFLRVEWDANGGKEYGQTETGAVINEGDIKYTNYLPIDVVRDYTKNNPNDDTWIILRDFENKFDLAAKYPEIKDDILDDSDDDNMISTTTLQANALLEGDNISVFTLLHKPTKAMPNGRYTQVLNNGTVLIDGPIPYKELHVHRLAPDEEIGSIFGYTVAFDLLPVQEAQDILYSTIITNQASFGVQNIMIPQGSNLSTSQLAGGLNVTEYDSKLGKPEVMQMLSTAPEIFNFASSLDKVGETLSAVNSAVRGNPESVLKSGVAIALVQASALQANSNLQYSYNKFNANVGTSTINILKDFAAVPRVAAIAGKSNRPLMKEFTGDNLDAIDRVTVDMGNPLTATHGGKANLADQLMERGLVDNADQYIQVITTGRLEPVIEGKQAELLLIKAENEGLADGIKQRALITDQHSQHIMEHKTVLANPEARKDPNSPIVVETLNHIQEHLDFLKSADPQLLALIKQQSMAMPVPGQMPQDSGTGDMLDPTVPVQQEAQGVGVPSQPSNPVTGETIVSQVPM